MAIKSVAIVGMGALGLMYGEHIQSRTGYGSVCFLMDRERIEKYSHADFYVNNEKSYISNRFISFQSVKMKHTSASTKASSMEEL